MNSFLVFLTAFSLATPSLAMTPTSKAQFCALSKSTTGVRELALDPSNTMAFRNDGGIANAGVCWWHSLMQRASFYLAIFRPTLPKPSESQAKYIIHTLASAKQVVEIPGYANFYDFSNDWKDLIQAKLEEWQLIDGFLNQEWIRGLSGSSSVRPGKLRAKMDRLWEEVMINNRISWVMLQIKGISAHAWLVADMELNNNTLTIGHLDSNIPNSISNAVYKEGQRSIQTQMYGEIVPYLGKVRDFVKFEDAVLSYCNSTVSSLSENDYIRMEAQGYWESIPLNATELDNDW